MQAYRIRCYVTLLAAGVSATVTRYAKNTAGHIFASKYQLAWAFAVTVVNGHTH